MQTLYIDVYFLINFTVDILALYFSAGFAKIPISVPRLIISALLGGTYAVLAIMLISNQMIMYPVSALMLVLMILICTKGVGTYRKAKYAVSFLLFQIIIGGLVYYSYCTLDKVMDGTDLSDIGGENRNLLILSLIVLLSIGVLKLVISFFGSIRSEKSASIVVYHNGKECKFEALVDSGNLAKDPFDKTPVMLINDNKASEIFGENCISENKLMSSDYKTKSKIRVIPVSFGKVNKILYGIKPDAVYALVGNRREKISVILAIDQEGDNYGGYSGLIPLSALEDIIYENR